MSNYDTSPTKRMLPQVAVATGLVLAVPMVFVWWLRSRGILASPGLCVLVAVLLSVVVSAVGSAVWKRRNGSERVVFSELLLWAWLRRLLLERKTANAVVMLRKLPAQGAEEASSATRARREELLGTLAAALDAQDPFTDGHSRRVARHAAMVAREMHLSDEDVQQIRAAALLHDVGKLRTPPALLSKPGALTPEEFEVVKRHAIDGAAMVADVGNDEITQIVLHHHERFDGTGYPSELGGNDIPLGARIVAVADTFDAITSRRPYRPAAKHKRALDALVDGAGTQLDPAAVRAFLRYYSGRKGTALLALFAVVPLQLVAWMRGQARVGGNLSVSELAATVGGLATIGLAAMGTAASVAIDRAGLPPQAPPPKLAINSASAAPPTISFPRSGAHTRRPAATSSLGAPVASTTAGGASAAVAASRRPSPPRRSRLVGYPGPAGHGSSSAAYSPPSTSPRAGGNPRQPGGSASSGTSPSQTRGNGGAGHPGSSTPGSPAPAPTPVNSGPTTGSGPSIAGGSGATTTGPSTSPSTPPTTSSGAPPSAPSGAGSTGTATGGSSAPPPGPPSAPTSVDQCKTGGYVQFGFTNQGECVASVQSHRH